MSIFINLACNFIKKRTQCFRVNFKNTFFTEHPRGTTSECRIEEQLKYHNGRDKSSDLFKYALETTNKQSNKNDFTILGSDYKGNTMKKVAEALVVKKPKPTLYI